MNESKIRHKARELALQILFQKEFLSDFDLNSCIEYFKSLQEAPDETWEYVLFLLNGIFAKQQDIDRIISDKSINWKISRMAPIDVSALRIATFEICFAKEEVPPKVAIDEAIELVKKYSGTDSPHFVNGILDEIYKKEGK